MNALARLAAFAASALVACAHADHPQQKSGAAIPARLDTSALKSELVSKHGEAARPRIERGVDQVVALWQADDGDMAAFVRENFIADPKQLDGVFNQ